MRPSLALVALVASLVATTTAHAQDARTLGAPTAPRATETAPATQGASPTPPPSYGYYVAPTQPAQPVRRDAPVPERARGGYQPTWALLGPGLGAFVSTYGAALLAGVEIELSYGTDEESAWLFVPVIGPWVLVGYADGSVDAQLGFALLGLAQTAGAALMIAGLAINARAGDDEVVVSFAPIAAPGSAGLSAVGRF